MKKLYNVQPKFMKAVLMTMVMLFLVAPNALKAQGTGTEADPFLISTKAQLEALRDRVNASTKFYHDGTTFVTSTVRVIPKSPLVVEESTSNSLPTSCSTAAMWLAVMA